MFTMVELGAGYGRWLVNAHIAAEQRGLGTMLVGVEGEPTRCSWMREHFTDNGIDPSGHRLVRAAAAAKEGWVVFQTGRADVFYGNRAATRVRNFGWPLRGGRLRLTRTVNLATAMRGLASIDLLDLDIEGFEADVLVEGRRELARVRRVHIGTHGPDVEQRLRDLFEGLGWRSEVDVPIGTIDRDVVFENGVQTWRNVLLDHHPS
jgi:FkbM family methyltransferase